MFGQNNQINQINPTQNAAQTADVIFDVSMADFEQRVLMASMQTPVLVDFWASWCGPCKQLMPVLEQVVKGANGAVKLAKVNIDTDPQLAQAFRVQSVPTVIALFQGQPVTGFQGVQSASQIQGLIDQLVKMARGAQPDALDIPAILKQAATCMDAGQFDEALALFDAILQQDPNQVEAYVGLVRCFIASGQTEAAAEMVAHAPEPIAKSPAFTAAKTALELAQNAPQGDTAALHARILANTADHEARLELAQILFARGQKMEAIEQLLESCRIDRMHNDEAARKQMLQFFDALGSADPATIAGRKALSRILFS